MSILIKTVRVNGFRALENIEVELELTTVLTGMNNTGKTSFLKVLQIVFGNRMFITPDDFCIKDNLVSDQIIIDVKIIPVDSSQNQIAEFDENFEILFTAERIRIDNNGNSFIPLRTIVSLNEMNGTYRTKQFILSEWYDFNENGTHWFQQPKGIEKIFSFEEIPFFYTNTQRDIIDDIKLKTSYLGRLISKIEHKPDVVANIEAQIKQLNENTVASSPILADLTTTLKELNSALDNISDGVEITPFTKKLRDLSKGLTIHYTDDKESFSMDYHGMGTRSWSSLLTLKALINTLHTFSETNDSVFFPILAVEEPESHLHPNAQKKLFSQLDSIPGQKIIATHSPYIAASANLSQIRGLYKKEGIIKFGKIDVSTFTKEDLRKVKRQVVHSRGEILFSKVFILFEGETEEQALPIFAEHFFDEPLLELGIDFVGVGGHGNYEPFLKVADSFNIPWYIFSDGEQEAIDSIEKQLTNIERISELENRVIFLNNGNSYEDELIANGYSEEIKSTILEVECVNEQHRIAKKTEIDNYEDAKILKYLKDNKTSTSPILAQLICESGKDLPPKIIELFQKIRTDIFNQNTSI